MQQIFSTTLLLLFVSISTYSQTNYAISDGSIVDCSGTIFDTGGQGAGGYSNNENHVLTICPNTPGDVITLTFTNFNLDLTNTAGGGGNNVDNMAIYDGNSTAATSLGTYTGTQLQGTFITGTSFNTTGCITIEFTSNDQGTGVFVATISCTTPCDRPTVVMNSPTVPNNPLKICDGDLVNFDGSGSYAAPNFTIQDYIWDWGDGTVDTLATGLTDHTFSSGPGEYDVNLYVIDDNDCISANLETIKIWVATTPSFVGTSADSLLCLGESVCIDGNVTPQTWVDQPESGLGGATYLPDNVGQCFTADLTYTQFNPGQTLTNINDLFDICVSMEHSYMGDLVATIYCPNGQNVVMHQQGGGGTNLGDPDQADDPLLPGTCAQYCWSPSATNGTWVDNSTAGATPSVYTNNTGSQSLNPGTYESLNPLSGLVGCPLNGTWSIEFCDLWGSDDGFVCDWSMDFNPNIYPSLTSFTPSIGTSFCDSSFWTASGSANSIITSTSGDCQQICLTPTTVGSYDYTYNVVDDHGCSFDTTITITVDPGPTVFAGNDTSICAGTDAFLNAVPSGGILPAPGCAYTINMYDTFGDGWNGFSIDVIINGNNIGNFTFQNGTSSSASFNIQDGDNIQFNATSGTFDTEVSYEVVDCAGNVIFQDGVNFGGNPNTGNNVWNAIASNPTPPNYNFSWTPAGNVTDPNLQNTTTSMAGQYIVEVSESGHPACSSTDTINVTIIPGVSAGNDSTITLCFNDPLQNFSNYLSGNPNLNGSWEDVNGNPLATVFMPDTLLDGVYHYIVANSAQCPSDTAFFNITILQAGNPLCGCPLLPSSSTTDVSCFGLCDGEVIINDPGATEYSFDGITWQTSNSSNIFCAGTHEVYSSNNNFGPTCIDTITITINEPQELSLLANSSDVSCFNACDGQLNVTGFGGITPYTYAWTGGPNPSNASQINVCAGLFNINLTDANGCQVDSIGISITEPPALLFDLILEDSASCNGSCDGSLEIQSSEAVLFSVDNGLTFQNSGIFSDLCSGNYNLIIEDTAGCQTSGSAIVSEPLKVFANFTFGPQPTTISQTQIDFVNFSDNASSFLWSFGEPEIGTSTNLNPSFYFPQISGIYPVCLVAQNHNECQDTICQDVIINDELIVYVPNSFTPDGDGLNDLFIPVLSGFSSEDYLFEVFDRWGHVVFSTNSTTQGWDGTVNGFPVDIKSDVYVWKLNIKAAHDNSPNEFVGHVSLLR